MADGHAHRYNRNADVRARTKELFYRDLSVKADYSDDDENDKSIRLAFSSEEPYLRWSPEFGDYYEVLGHNDGEIDNKFIASGRAPLLLDHDRRVQIGVVRSVDVSEGRGRASVKFSRNPLATEIWNDVRDGIRTNVSVGYYVNEQKVEAEVRDGIKVVRVTKWTPKEVSLVSIPADETVGIGRSDEQQEAEAQNNKDKEITRMTTENQTTPTFDVEAIKRETRAAEQARVREISALGAKYGMQAKAEEFIKNNKDVALFREYVLENLDTRQSNNIAAGVDANIGMSKKDVKAYSLMRAIRALANPGDRRAQEDAAFEREASEAAEKLEKRTARGLIVPYDVLRTRQLDGTAGQGAELIGTDHLAGSFIEMLRNRLVIAQFNPTMLTGLVGDASIPGQSASAANNWFDPAALTDGGETELTTRAVPLSPKYVRAVTAIARNTINQATPDVETMVRNDLVQSLATSIDKAVFEGTGASFQPTGIKTAVTQIVARFAAAVPTFAELVAMKAAVDVGNALAGNLGYVTDPTTAAGLETKSKDAGSGLFVLENGRAAGYPVVSSNQITAGDVYFGNFNDVVIASWGGLDVTVDTAKYAGSGGVRVIAIQDVDIALRHEESFAWNNDTP